MTYILRDCVEYDIIYYILHFTDENVNREDIDLTINQIKQDLYDRDTYWDINDMFRRLSTIYDFTIFNFDGYLEI